MGNGIKISSLIEWNKRLKKSRNYNLEDKDFIALYIRSFNYYYGDDKLYKRAWEKFITYTKKTEHYDAQMLNRKDAVNTTSSLASDFFEGKVSDLIERLKKIEQNAEIEVFAGLAYTVEIKLHNLTKETDEDWYRRIGGVISELSREIEKEEEEKKKLQSEKEQLLKRLEEINNLL